MKIGIPSETRPGETRVSSTPEVVKKLAAKGFEPMVECGAGVRAGYPDAEYAAAGATLTDRAGAYDVDLLLRVRRPEAEDVAAMRAGGLYIGLLESCGEDPVVAAMLAKGMRVLAMERMPRTSRWLVGSMAVLSAMTGLLSLTVSYAAGVAPAQIVAVVEVAVLIAIALRLMRQGYWPAAMFLAAFGLYYIGIVLRVARNFMLLPPNLLTDNSFQISAIAHMVVMSLAIFYRYNSLRAAAEQAQAETLMLKTKRAEALEDEVAARTRSLTAEIARREQLEADLRTSLDVEKLARQEQRDFVEMVSHEFRTPLAIVDTSVQRIAGSEPSAATRERCSNIRQATRRMIRLMDEFLSLDRVDGDLATFTAVDEDAAAIVRGAAAEWDQGSIEVACIDLPRHIACDAGLLRIALRNLLANAMRHSPAGVAVRLHAQGRADGGIDFAVADAGCGIPADEIPRLFQKYFRGRGAQNKPGAGLGLYLVERIATLHGGTVAVTSSAAGSRFVLAVPGGAAIGPDARERPEGAAKTLRF